jgi:hypothetical protein
MQKVYLVKPPARANQAWQLSERWARAQVGDALFVDFEDYVSEGHLVPDNDGEIACWLDDGRSALGYVAADCLSLTPSTPEPAAEPKIAELVEREVTQTVREVRLTLTVDQARRLRVVVGASSPGNFPGQEELYRALSDLAL